VKIIARIIALTSAQKIELGRWQSKRIDLLSENTLVMIQTKFGSNWSSSFREEDL